MAEAYWTDEKHTAAELLAEGKQSLGEIAEQLLRTPKTLLNWRNDPIFAERVAELRDLRRAEIRRVGIAEQEQRMAAIQADFAALDTIMAERAKDATLGKLPGGKTGLLILGPGKRPVLDTKLLKARLLLMQAMAVESGQWKVKADTGLVDIETAVKRTADAAATYTEDRDDEDPDA